MGNYLQANNTLLTHLILLTIAWVPLANISVFMALFKHRLYGYYAHAILSWLIIIITLITTLIYIIPKGLPSACQITQTIECDPYQFPLAIEGTVLIVWIAVQIFSGIWARAHQENPLWTSKGVIRSKRFHMYSGIIIMLLGKANTFIHWRNQKQVWIPLLVFEIVSITAYVKTKWFFRTLEQSIKDVQIEQITEQIPEIKYLEDLDKGTQNYAVFCDYVYDISCLQTLHPAGYQVIELTRGRQVDRFIYGMYGAELVPQVPAFSHPVRSFDLVGKPVAKITITSPYDNLIDLQNCKISYIETVSAENNIYIVGFGSLNGKGFRFRGYSELAQAGQYFSLTMGKTTRLYTTVNSLAKANQRLMGSISSEMRGKNPVRRNINAVPISHSNVRMETQQNPEKCGVFGPTSDQGMKTKPSIEQIGSSGTEQLDEDEECVPLMIKRYDTGKLTPILIGEQFPQDIIISCPRGQGLKLELQRPGQIVFIAGGTGFYPFMDIVDLLYKQKVLREKLHSTRIREKILELNPVLRQQVLTDHNFLVMVAIVNADDLHPISLYQLNALAESRSTPFRCLFRVKHGKEEFQSKYPNIKLTNDYFDQLALDEAKNPRTSKIYICGPPAMNSNVGLKLKENGISQKKFQLV